MEPIEMKIVLLGESAVGKTALVDCFLNNKFDPNQRESIGGTFFSKSITIDEYTASLKIWDTAGAERFHALAPLYYRGADGALLVYDSSNPESFDKVKMSRDLCKTHLLSIINSMTRKEKLNKELMKLDNITFLSKISSIQNRVIPRECIEQNNVIISFLKKEGINYAETQPKIKEEEGKEKEKEKESVKEKRPKEIERDSIGGISKSQEGSMINLQEIIYPPVDLSILQNKNINLVEEDELGVSVNIRLILKDYCCLTWFSWD